MEASSLEVRFVHMTPHCSCCPYLAPIRMVVCRILEPLSGGGGISLCVCYIWFS